MQCTQEAHSGVLLSSSLSSLSPSPSGVMKLKYQGSTAPTFGAKKLTNSGPQLASNPGFTWNQITITGGAEKVPDWAYKVDK